MRTSLRLLIIATLLAGPALSVRAEEPRVSAPGLYSGYSPRLYASYQRSSVYIPTRDGTRLAADIYRPLHNGAVVETPYPVIWMHTPYIRGTRAADGSIQLSGTRYMNPRDLTRYGYVFVVVDTRGKGASFGHRRGMQDSTEARDAYDVTEWLALQPWSTGRIGMMGCSYVGGTQDNAATTTPPHLAAIFPGATSWNRYDMVSRGGLTAQFHTRPEDPRDFGEGTLPVDEDRDGSMLAAARAQHSGNTIMAEIWRDIPFRDDWSPSLGSRFWEETSLSTYRNQVERFGPVMYRWTGWEDEFSPDQFVARANLRNVMHVTIGPERHCQSTQFDMFPEHLRYFDRYLKGVDNGIDREPFLYYYTYNAPAGHEWAASSVWPIAGTQMRRVYLADAESPALTWQRPAREGATRFEVDYSVVNQGSETPLWPASQFGHGISFRTAAFTEPMRLTGHAIASLWVSTSTPDADIFAYVEEVHPDGSVAVRMHGRLRASHRLLGTAPFDYLGLPWHRSFREDYRPMVPGVPQELRFDLLPTSTIVQPGSYLRLVVTGADPRQRQHLSFPQPPVIALHSGGSNASYVELPVVPLTPLPATGASQPGRP